MTVSLYCATFFLTLVTLIPLWRNPHWLVRGWEFPRTQLIVIATIILIAGYIWLDFAINVNVLVILIAGACLLWHIIWVAPYSPLWPIEVLDSKAGHVDAQLSVITANVLTPNKKSHLLINHVKQYKPDVLLTLESDAWWEKQLDVLEKDMPYTVKYALDNLYGIHVYSRLPLEGSKVSFLVEKDVPSIETVLTLRTGDQIKMHFLHPAPPSPTENEESTERDAELMILAKKVAKTKQPVIVTGDLNDVAWSATTRLFRKISGLLDPRIGRGVYSTFHAKYPLFRWPVDQFFHSQHFTLNQIKRLPSIGSDHFAILTVLTFTGQKHSQQEGLDAEKSDKVRAKQIVKNAQDKQET